MKTERRHELQTNELADTLGTFISRVRPYSRLIAAGLVAIVMLLAAVGYVKAKSTARESVGWEQFFQGFFEQDEERLVSTAEGYNGTTAAIWARLTMADINLYDGSARLMTDKAGAKDLLLQAGTNYRTVLNEAKQDLVLQRAHLGLGRTYEAQNQLDQARREYGTLIKQWPDTALAQVARDRTANLDRPATKHFYDWLAKYSPPRQVSQPGTPGKKPSFDIENVNPNDVKLPSVLGGDHPTPGPDGQGPLLPQPGSQGLETPDADGGAGTALPVPGTSTTSGESPAAAPKTSPPTAPDKGDEPKAPNEPQAPNEPPVTEKPKAAAPADTTP